MLNSPMGNEASRAHEVRPPWIRAWGRLGTRRRCQLCLIWGGACICLGTFLPWVVARFDVVVWWPMSGMDLTYAHFPPVTIGYVSLVLGGACVLAGRVDAQRAGHAELGMVPAGVAAFFLWFVNASLHGNLGRELEAIKGFEDAWLGPGYWLMMIGTALAIVGSFGAAAFVRNEGSLSLDPVEAMLDSDDIRRLEQLTGSGRRPLDRSSV